MSNYANVLWGILLFFMLAGVYCLTRKKIRNFFKSVPPPVVDATGEDWKKNLVVAADEAAASVLTLQRLLHETLAEISRAKGVNARNTDVKKGL